MKYMLLIHQGTATTPQSDEWESLSEDEKGAVYGAYKALNETPGFTSGVQMQPPETATTVQVQDGKTLTTDGPFAEIKEARRPAWAGRSRCARSWSGSDPRAGLRRPVGTCPR